ncbi:Mg-chelatase subunit ChlD [Streptomyces olivoverticillatus]|uniref:Mg-chelatase subunit ChlD n=1 Tax=Streptomyces olivoverticillatus TaxID=66427 RepID=A0A7W7LK08_9ACTN|nr:VWA domain-containing protein [Streptomyces olivoverticillatus]MBB4891630.1 Mg-chelatase subunit ChlD [Streptomyces olivoverticillatus]
MSDHPIEILVLPERPAARNDEVTEFDVAIEVRCRSAEDAERAGGAMNLCLVIDRSGSMGGQDKLPTATRSCIDISRRLTGDDLFTVVVFDHTAHVVINPQTPRDQVEERLTAITPGGSTNLSLGWYQGLLELQSHMTADHYGRLILLSDGQANQGETKKAALAAVATRARDEGITTSTIGIGSDFQEDLLEAIATASGGRFWYIAEAGIDDILEEEFRSALTVVVDRPRVELSLPPGVTVSEELNSLRKISRRYGLRPLKGQDTFDFAVRLEIDPAQVDGSEFTLGAALYDGSREIATTEQTIALAPLSDVAATESHALVTSVVEQYRASATEEKLLKDMASGDLSNMTEMLTAEIARVQRIEAGLFRQSPDIGETRVGLEIGHLRHNRQLNETTLLVKELLDLHRADPEVRYLLLRMRKSFMHEKQRKSSLYHDVSEADEDIEVTLLVRALGVADILIQRHPENSVRLEEMRERLRERLALIQ